MAVDPDTFAAEHWARRPLLSTAAELGGFEDLLSLDAVDELVSRRGLRTPFLRIAKEGNVLDPSRFTAPGGAGAEIGDQVADDKVLGLVLDGATLVLQALHRVWPPLVSFASALGTDLGHPVQVNAYVTPPQSRGFDPHYDVHDVFVLQVAGEKRWVVHEPVHPAPLRTQPWTDHRRAVADRAAADDPVIDTVLRPGDALYLPRGYLHAAEALGDVSVHLTVGVHPVTRYALVEALAELAAEDEALRGSLPMGLDLADPVPLEPEVDATLAALRSWLDGVDAARVVERVRRRAWPATRPAPIGPLAQAAAVVGLAEGDRLVVRAGLRRSVRVRGERVVLQLTDRHITFPLYVEPALKALLGGETVVLGVLPGLDTADQLTLARRLLREAVVVPADDPGEP